MLLSWFGGTDDAIARDASRLMDQMGNQAFWVAGELSWREDAGLLVVKRPGHWRLVQAKIGKLTGESLPVRHIHADAEGWFSSEMDRATEPAV